MTVSSCGLYNKTVNKIRNNKQSHERVDLIKKVETNTSLSVSDISERGTIKSMPGKFGSIGGKMENGVGVLKDDSTGVMLVALMDSLSGRLTITYNIPGGFQADWYRGQSDRDSSSNYVGTTDSAANRSNKESVNNVDKVSKPAIGGTIALWVGISISIIAFVWIIGKVILKR